MQKRSYYHDDILCIFSLDRGILTNAGTEQCKSYSKAAGGCVWCSL